MAKRKSTQPSGPATDQSISRAMPKKEFTALLARIMASKGVVAKEQKSVRELKGDAVDLHRGALSWMVRLKSMTPAKRNEQLFHFHAYCDYLGWPEKGLDLGDREPARDPADEVIEADKSLAEEMSDAIAADQAAENEFNSEDLRPRFLRTGGVAPGPDEQLKPN